MIHAAGVLFICDDKVLLVKRSAEGDMSGFWAIPGGKLEGDETAEQAAERECREELGFVPKGARALLCRRVSSDVVVPGSNGPQPEDIVADQPQPVDYTTFVQRVNERFDPILNDEHTGYCWAAMDDLPAPMHPGCLVAFQRINADELGVARLMAAGEIVSPQHYGTLCLYAMRVTGTGLAYRKGLDEHVWRDPDLYLNEDFLSRCAGLPIIWEHPPGRTLTSKEYHDRVIGAVMFAYIRGDEVWCIARIHDDEAAQLMGEDVLSTSPAVVFGDPTVNSKLKTEDGSTLLVEGKPSLLDHLAVCERGVWDKGGDPSGIASQEIRGDSIMTEEEKRAAEKKVAEEKKVADAARADADAGEKLDKILSCLDSVSGRLDAMEESSKRMDARMDAMETKKDSDEEEKKKKEEEEAKKADKSRKDGDDDEKTKAEKEAAEKVAADKARKDAEDEEKKKKEEDARDDAARADSEVQKLIKRLDSIDARTKPMTDADYEEMAMIQARADSVYAVHGQHASRPMQGESKMAYRRRLLQAMQPHSKPWSGVNLAALSVDQNAFAIAEQQIYSDALNAGKNPVDLGEGELRPVLSRDRTGREITEFVGSPKSWLGGFSGAKLQLVNISNKER